VLDRALAVLAVTASQALYVTDRSDIPGPLHGLLELIRKAVPPIAADRPLGIELHGLSRLFTARVLDDTESVTSN
jgi:histidine ammonia-lyase